MNAGDIIEIISEGKIRPSRFLLERRRQNPPIQSLPRREQQAAYKCSLASAELLFSFIIRMKGLLIRFISGTTDPSGWWQGRLRGKQGLLPGNYVQKL